MRSALSINHRQETWRPRPWLRHHHLRQQNCVAQQDNACLLNYCPTLVLNVHSRIGKGHVLQGNLWRVLQGDRVIRSSQRTLFAFLAWSQTRSRWMSESDRALPLAVRDVHGYASRQYQGLNVQLGHIAMAFLLIGKNVLLCAFLFWR